MKVLLLVLLVLLILLLLPFGGAVRYDQDGFATWVKALCFRFQVFPGKEGKKPKEKKPKEKPKEKKPKGDKGAETPQGKKKGGALSLVRAALPLVKPALAGVKRRLTIDELELFVTWRSDDPADAAIGYGRANAALGALWALIEANFKVKKSRLGCAVDFDGGESAVYLDAALSLNLWKVLTLVLPLLIRFLCNYARLKRAGDDKTKKEA